MNHLTDNDNEFNTALAVVNRHAPYQGQSGLESLDFVMAMANFGLTVSVFFMDDGVFQLLQHQQAASILRKPYTKGFAALKFYDVDNLFVCADSLLARGISADQLVISLHILSPAELQLKLRQHQHVVTF